MPAKLSVDSKVGVSCPDIGIVFDCMVQSSTERSAIVKSADKETLPVFDPGTILRLTSEHGALWGIVASSSKKKLEITDIDSWDKKNRREFFRLSLLEPIELMHVGEDGQLEPSIKGQLLDISAAGMRFSCTGNWAVDEQVHIIWSSFHFLGKIVRANEVYAGHTYGCQFIDMDAKTQDALMREIFSIQLKQRRAR